MTRNGQDLDEGLPPKMNDHLYDHLKRNVITLPSGDKVVVLNSLWNVQEYNL